MPLDWEPSEENIEKCSQQQAKYIFEQAEKMLKEITETNVLIVTRTTTLISFAVAFMLGLVGFLFNRFSKIDTMLDAQLITCLVAILYVFGLCRILVENIQGREYEIVGAEPKKLFIDPFFKETPLNDEELKYFYINEIWMIQNKIQKNVLTNDKRWELFNKSLWRLLYTPIVITSTFFFLKLLVLCFGPTFYYLLLF